MLFLLRAREAFWVFLFPLSALTAFVGNFRRSRKRESFRPSVPVISVGNLHLGGVGKTPLVATLATYYATRSPVILSRGYGGSLSKKGAWVDASSHGAEAVGDEPWMLSSLFGARVRVGRNRVQSARLAEGKKAGLLLLDDGFQHLALERDVNLVVLPGWQKPESSYCFPLGDLRESLSSLKEASAVLLTGEEEGCEAWRVYLTQHFPDLPFFRAEKKVDGLFRGKERYQEKFTAFGAFCGIGFANGFLSDLRKNIGEPAFFEVFQDHEPYSHKKWYRLDEKRKKIGNQTPLVTTDKDWYKGVSSFGNMEKSLFSLRISYQLPEAFYAFIESRVAWS